MIVFYIIIGVVFIALGFVFWLIWKEHNEGGDGEGPKTKAKEKDVTAAGLLDRLGLEPNMKTKPSTPQQGGEGAASLLAKLFPPKKASLPAADESPTDSAQEQEPPSPDSTEPQPLEEAGNTSGTAGLRLNNTQEDSLDAEVELAVKSEELQRQITEINEQKNKLETLIAEKNETLEKTQKELEQERKHRKEFNKVKDLLEKELKESKDAAKQVQTELTSLKSESQTYTNRIAQLEDKIKNLEKTCIEKDAAIEQLTAQSNAPGEPQPSSEQTEAAQETDEAPAPTADDDTATLETMPETPPIDASPETAEQPASDEPLDKRPPETEDNTASEIPAAEETPETTEAAPEKETQPAIAAPEENAKTSEENDALSKLAETTIDDAEPEESPTSENPLGLDPVSNLEENYETDAAPLPVQYDNDAPTDAPSVDNNTMDEPAEPATETKEDLPELGQQQENDNQTLTDDSATESPKQSSAPEEPDQDLDQRVNQFLTERLNSAATEDEPETVAAETPPDPTPQPDVENDEQLPTDVVTDESGAAKNNTDAPVDDLSTPVAETDNNENGNSDDDSAEEANEGDGENNDDQPSEKEKVHLNPDIFKDIENQFRQIEEELSTTEDENGTVNPDDELSPPAEDEPPKTE